MPLITTTTTWIIVLTRIVTLAVAVAAVLAGCTQTVTRTVTRDVPRAVPTPSLIGTWTTTEQVDDDRVREDTRVFTLTFTKSRAIMTASIRDSGREFDRWREQDTWSATDTTVTRTWYAWDEENDRRMNEPTNFVKKYSFADEGDTLFLHPWLSDDDPTRYWRYTRVNNPIQDLLTSTWESYYERPDGKNWRYTISFSDNSFTWSDVTTEGESVAQYLLEGSYVHDVENGFILVMITAFTYTQDGVQGEPPEREGFVGHTLRWAYAPTERPDIIAVSPYWREQKWNQATRTWEDRRDLSNRDFVPYGEYDQRYTRMDRTN